LINAKFWLTCIIYVGGRIPLGDVRGPNIFCSGFFHWDVGVFGIGVEKFGAVVEEDADGVVGEQVAHSVFCAVVRVFGDPGFGELDLEGGLGGTYGADVCLG
jgi:hypothetical protein